MNSHQRRVQRRRIERERAELARFSLNIDHVIACARTFAQAIDGVCVAMRGLRFHIPEQWLKSNPEKRLIMAPPRRVYFFDPRFPHPVSEE